MRKIFASCALLFCALISHAHALGDDPRQEFTRQIRRQFATTANGMTVLYNAHGDIAIQTLPNTQEVKVDVTIIVKAKSKQEADRIFDAIQVNFTHTPGYVKAQTMLQKNFPESVGCKEFKVNYQVNMPADNQLELSNRYGNTHIVGGLNGKLSAEIKYGDLALDHPVNETQFLLGYGKLKAAQIGFAQGQLNYAQFDANQTGELRLESKYSKIKVERSDNIILTSRYDDLNFGTVTAISLRAKYGTTTIREVRSACLTAEYSDFDIRSLRELLDANLSYGKLNIVSLGRDFKEARVNTRYTDVVIQVEPGAKFRFDTEGKHNKISYPSAALVNKRTESGENSILRGYVGDANSRRIVVARVDYGRFVIRQ